MNAHKKLRGMGFKKTKFYIPGYHPESGEYTMLLDEERESTKMVDGKTIKIKEKKIHPKSDSFWIFNYNTLYTFWAKTQNDIISTIWIENKSVKLINTGMSYWSSNKRRDERLKVIYDINNRGSFRITNKEEIMNILPKDVKRDFILDQLFS